jgi:hypothetical protein
LSEPKSRYDKTQISVMLTNSLLERLTDEKIKEVFHCESRSDLIEKALNFIEANEEYFVEGLMRQMTWNELIHKAIEDRDQETMINLMAFESLRVEDFNKPIKLVAMGKVEREKKSDIKIKLGEIPEEPKE